jgi:uncharacterized PurR-regulated membrane protein YhhQ (DUF165 family)|tara:strand:+ start:142 stop:597 length:456 start_codon:yes stop_codon:yes gene_type:complete
MKYVALYIFSVVLVNYGFSSFSGYEWFWSIVVGTVFITRDYCQRAVGHWCIAAMVVAGVLSYFMADPYVAIASVSAFAVAELVDWIVYSLTKRPLADRILISSAIATPLDTVVFLSMLGLLTPSLIGFQVASKMLAAVAIWSMLRFMVKKS